MNTELYETITSHRHRALRVTTLPDLSAEYAEKKLSPRARMSDRFVRLMDAEVPHILPGQKIVFMRTVGSRTTASPRTSGRRSSRSTSSTSSGTSRTSARITAFF